MSASPGTAYTLEQFISLGRGVNLTYKNYSFRELLTNGTEISVRNVVSDYMEELELASLNVKFDDAQYRRYRFRPKILCYDIYGCQELYFVICLLNGVIDVKEFDFRTCKMPTRAAMAAMMSAIYNAEYKYIGDYNSEHGTT